MPRIAAGANFGQAVPAAVGVADVSMPNPGRGLIEIGRRQEARGLQVEQQAANEAAAVEREQKQAREAADRARASSVLSLTRDKVADTLSAIDQDVQDGRLPKADAMKAWRERTQELIQGSLGDAPETHKALIQQDLQGLVSRFDSKVADSVRRRDQHDTRADLGATLESLQRSATQDYGKARASAFAALDTLGPAAGMAPDAIQRAKQSWAEGAAYTRAFTAVNAAKMDNRALDAAAKAIAGNQDLDTQRQAQLLAQVDNYRAANEARALRAAQDAEIAAARADRESANAWGVLADFGMAGKTMDPAASAPLVAKLNKTHLAAYRAMTSEIPARVALGMQPVAVVQQRLDQLVAQSFKAASPELEAEIKRTRAVLEAQKKGYNGIDDLRTGAQFGVIDRLTPIDTTSLDGMVTSLAGRVGQAQAVETRTGRPVSPLLSEEAGRLGDMLGKLPPQQQARAIAQLSQALPSGMRQALAQQIDAKDKGLALAFAAGADMTTAGRTTAEIILRGRQARLDGTSTKGEKQPDVKAASWKAHAAAELDGVFLNQQHASQVRDAAELIMHGLAAEKGGQLSRDDMNRAVRLALGSGEIVEHNGRRIPLPAAMSESDFNKRLESVTRADLLKQAPTGMVRAGGVEVFLEDFVKSLPGVELAPVRPGSYAPLVGGRPVVNHAGEPIVIEAR